FRKWSVRLHPRNGAPFDAALTVVVARDRTGNVTRMHWIVRNAGAQGPAKERLHPLPANLMPQMRPQMPARTLSQLSRNELFAHLHAVHAAHARAEEGTELIVRLQSITAGLSEARTPDEVAAVIVDRGAQALGSPAALLTLLSDDGADVTMAHALGIPEKATGRWRHFPISTPTVVTHVIRSGAPIFPDSE